MIEIVAKSAFFPPREKKNSVEGKSSNSGPFELFSNEDPQPNV